MASPPPPAPAASLTIDRDKPLFCAVLPVWVESPLSPSSLPSPPSLGPPPHGTGPAPPVMHHYIVRLCTGSAVKPSGVQVGLLQLELCDDLNLYYSGLIYESDWAQFKSQLEVHAHHSWSSTSTALQRLLSTVQVDDRYALNLNCATGGFKFIQRTDFNCVTHATVQVHVATDEEFKSYLKHALQVATSTGVNLNRRITQLEENIVDLNSRLETAAVQVGEKEAQFKSAMDLNSALQAQFKSAQLETERALEAARFKYTSELELLRATVSTWSERHATVSSQLESTRLELSQAREETGVLSSRLEATSTAAAAAVQVHTSTVSRVHELELQLARLEAAHDQRLEELKSASTSTAAVSTSLSLYKSSCAALQFKLEGSVLELQRGNDVIQRLQAQFKSMKRQFKSSETARLEMAQALEREREFKSTLEVQVQALEAKVTALNREVQVGREREAQFKSALATAAANAERDATVIAYLNRELNDVTLQSKSTASSAPTATPASSTVQVASLSPAARVALLSRGATSTGKRADATLDSSAVQVETGTGDASSMVTPLSTRWRSGGRGSE